MLRISCETYPTDCIRTYLIRGRGGISLFYRETCLQVAHLQREKSDQARKDRRVADNA